MPRRAALPLLLLWLRAAAAQAPPPPFRFVGPVMVNPVTVYPVYYGNWSASDPRPALLAQLIAGVAATPYWRPVELYTGADGAPPTSSLAAAPPSFANCATDSAFAAWGCDWGVADFTAPVLHAAISHFGLPVSADCVYVLLPDEAWRSRAGYCARAHS